MCSLIRGDGGGEMWRCGCKWYMVSVVVVLGVVDGRFGIGQ
jgi:hypothetical protein